MERAMKKRLFALFYALGFTTFAAWYHRKRTIFLCYHGVTKRPIRSESDPKGLHVNERRFAEHLDFLERHYHVISLPDYINARVGCKRLPQYCVVLTFDDGFRNFLTVAAPALAARHFPATVFLITDRASEETKKPDFTLNWIPEDDERYLSWADARFLKDELGFEIGSHTCSHSGLLTLSADETEHELLHSYNDLITQLNLDAAALSYPKGQYSQLLANDALKIGYRCAVTTDRGLNELDHDLFTLGRTLIGDNDDIAGFAVRISGLRYWLASLRDALLKPSAKQSRKLRHLTLRRHSDSFIN
jgi:peptidoglycan/xylan/chitin deacetylase (PgdA/CDA1 family)